MFQWTQQLVGCRKYTLLGFKQDSVLLSAAPRKHADVLVALSGASRVWSAGPQVLLEWIPRDITQYLPCPSIRFLHGRLAGGAISAVDSPLTLISNAIFFGNHAHSSNTSTGFKTSTSAYACGNGHGGAACLVGSPGSNITVHNTLFLYNTASFGGGMSLHADSSCTLQQLSRGCFSASIDASCFTNNTAYDGGGGAVFWTHSGNLNISCGSQQDTLVVVQSGSAVTAAPVSSSPCSDWLGNEVTGVGYGPTIASTAFQLTPVTSQVPYYTSNTLLPLSVTVQVRVASNRSGVAGEELYCTKLLEMVQSILSWADVVVRTFFPLLRTSWGLIMHLYLSPKLLDAWLFARFCDLIGACPEVLLAIFCWMNTTSVVVILVIITESQSRRWPIIIDFDPGRFKSIVQKNWGMDHRFRRFGKFVKCVHRTLPSTLKMVHLWQPHVCWCTAQDFYNQTVFGGDALLIRVASPAVSPFFQCFFARDCAGFSSGCLFLFAHLYRKWWCSLQDLVDTLCMSLGKLSAPRKARCYPFSTY